MARPRTAGASSRRRSVLAPAAVALLVSAAGFASFPGTAAADATYEAVAEANGVQLVITNQSIPLGVAPKLQGPVAFARQTSLQQSDAYAAFPYPGEELAGLPGVAVGSVGEQAGFPLPSPAYPFAVNTSFGDDVRQLSYPGIELRSESGETVTQAAATGGSSGAGATSEARISREGDAVAARATSDADAVRLGNNLVISGVRAAATAARDPGGALVRTSHLSFSKLSAPGLALTLPGTSGAGGPSATQRVGVPEIGFVDGKFSVTFPGTETQGAPVPAAEVLGALKAAGYTATYQAPRDTANGIVGAGLQISTTLPAPPPNSPGGLSGETPVTLTLGLARAEVSYAAAKAPAAGVPVATGTTPAAGGPAATVPAAGTPGVLPATAPVGPAVLPTAPLAPGAAPVAPVPGFVPGQPAAAAADGVAVPLDLTGLTAYRAAVGSDVGWIYLMIVAVAGSALAATFVLRYGGVRS